MAFKIHIGQCLDCPPATKSLIVTKKGRCAKHTYLFNQAKKSRPKSDKSYSVLDKTEKKKEMVVRPYSGIKFIQRL